MIVWQMFGSPSLLPGTGCPIRHTGLIWVDHYWPLLTDDESLKHVPSRYEDWNFSQKYQGWRSFLQPRSLIKTMKMIVGTLLFYTSRESSIWIVSSLPRLHPGEATMMGGFEMVAYLRSTGSTSNNEREGRRSQVGQVLACQGRN